MVEDSLSFAPRYKASGFRPGLKKAALTYDITLPLAGSLLIAAAAQLAVWPPFSPVPVTGQTFAVLIIAALYGGRRAVLAVLAYLAQGAAGLPVFASGAGGIAWLTGPTGGYLFGFAAAAFVVGRLAEQGWDRQIWTAAAAMTIGNLIIYCFGVLWLLAWNAAAGQMVSAGDVIRAGVEPFIPGDIIKIVLAALLLPTGWKLLSLFRNV